MAKDEHPKVEDWADTAQLRHFLYVRRGYMAGVEKGFLTVKEVTAFTQRLEKLSQNEVLSEAEHIEIADLRTRLFILEVKR